MSDKETKLVTSGRRKEWTHGIVNPPVYRASTCIFETYKEMRERVADPAARHLFYGRKGTPTQWSLEDALTELEGGAGTMLYPSGMGAITGAMLAFVKAGDHILINDSIYEPTRTFADGMLKNMNISTTYYDPMIGSGIKDLMQENTTLVVAEAPGSLTFEVQDLPATIAAAKDHRARVIVDNTWATPLFLNPLAMGADVVVHAITKYIGGHSDVMMGSATANSSSFKQLRRTAYQLGQTVSADDAALALRGLRTLGVRLQQHEESALKIAAWLSDHPMVETVLHPALASCPGHETWQRDFNGSCGLFSFILKGGDYPDTAALVDEMQLFKMGFSWGGYESLILPSDPRACRSATPWQSAGPVIRLHIGLESVDDLITELDEGLKRYGDAAGV